MKLKELVTSFELSKKLKDLGIEQDSCFAYFFKPYDMGWELLPQNKSFIGVAAFTSSELGELLPDRLKQNLCIVKILNGWEIGYEIMTNTQRIHERSLSNAMAKMLIYLLENGYIKNEA